MPMGGAAEGNRFHAQRKPHRSLCGFLLSSCRSTVWHARHAVTLRAFGFGVSGWTVACTVAGLDKGLSNRPPPDGLRSVALIDHAEPMTPCSRGLARRFWKPQCARAHRPPVRPCWSGLRQRAGIGSAARMAPPFHLSMKSGATLKCQRGQQGMRSASAHRCHQGRLSVRHSERAPVPERGVAAPALRKR